MSAAALCAPASTWLESGHHAKGQNGMTVYGHDLVDIFINWFPMILLIGVWILFLSRMRKGPYMEHQKTTLELARRQAESLERIAAALEKKGG
jgi:ATP-dependent Zn protease